MKIKELIVILNAYNPELEVCFFSVPEHEYYTLDADDGSIEKVWDEDSESWILSLNEGDDSLKHRLMRIGHEII